MDFNFELVVVLNREGQEPLIIKKVLPSIYHTVLPIVAFNISKFLIDEGWSIVSITTRNYEFKTGTQPYPYPD